jgi:hypothetical protein
MQGKIGKWPDCTASAFRSFQILNTETAATEIVLSKIDQAIANIEIARAEQRADTGAALAWLRTECERTGMRQVAKTIGVDPGIISRVLSGERIMSSHLLTLIKQYCSQ